VFPYPVTTRVLDNGLKVVLVPFDSPGIVAYYTIVRTGSRNEVEPGLSGFAHFFEHMMFRGTEKYSTDAYNDLFKVLGSDANAYTSDDVTVYHSLFGKDGLAQVIDAESDRFMNLNYSESDFQQEAKAILGEYNKNASNPERKLYERIRETAFTEHTYRHTTMGFIDDIVDMPNQYDYSLTFFDRYYRPGNVVVLIVGDFQIETAFGLVKTHYGRWEANEYEPVIPTEPEQTTARSSAVAWDSKTLPYLGIAFKTPAFSTENNDCAAIDILSKLVFDNTSPLYQKLILKDQTCESVSGYMADRRDPGIFLAYTKIKEEKDIDEVRAAIYQAIEDAKNNPVNDEQLAAIKSNIRYDLAMSLDTARSVAAHLTHFIQLTADPNQINAAYQRYEEVTAEDIQRVARKYFTRARSTEVTLIHAEATN